MYKIKKGIPKGAKVHVMRPKRIINVDTITKTELKLLFDLGHPYVEKA